MTIIKFKFLFLVIWVFHGCGSPISNEDLRPYVLPPQDSELVYSLLDGGQMITRIISFNDEEVHMEDVMDIPKNMQLPEGVKWSDFGVKDRKATYRYSYIFQNNHVQRRNKRDEAILLRNPIAPLASAWEVTFSIYGGETVERFGECQIVKVKRKRVLNEERKTLTVDCVDQTTDQGTTLFRNRFAKGLGIIEKSMYHFEDSSVNVDSVPPVDLIQLIEIRPNTT